VNQISLEKSIRNFRFRLTRSQLWKGELWSASEIRLRRAKFIRSVHAEYKEALEIIVEAQLEVEGELASASTQERGKLEHWKAILELCFNALVWIALKWERDHVKRLFTGPKYGTLKSRNAKSALHVVNRMNEVWSDFAIPLDFARFESAADILRVRFDPTKETVSQEFIEVKEGRVNSAILDTVRGGTQEDYLRFFDSYGKHGVKQIERYFRQAKKLKKALEMMTAKEGDSFDTTEGKLFIFEPKRPSIRYSDGMSRLLKYLRRRAFGTFIVDNCLLVGGFRVDKPESLSIGEFLFRHQAHHIFSPECAFCADANGRDWMGKFAAVNIFDGCAMFGSVPFDGLITRPVSDSDMLDLLFGRIRLMFYLDGDRFIELCKVLGLDAGYSTGKETNRLRSQGSKGLVEFGAQFIWMKKKDHELTAYVSEGMLHDMCLNWVHPYWWVSEHAAMSAMVSSRRHG